MCLAAASSPASSTTLPERGPRGRPAAVDGAGPAARIDEQLVDRAPASGSAADACERSMPFAVDLDRRVRVAQAARRRWWSARRAVFAARGSSPRSAAAGRRRRARSRSSMASKLAASETTSVGPRSQVDAAAEVGRLDVLGDGPDPLDRAHGPACPPPRQRRPRSGRARRRWRRRPRRAFARESSGRPRPRRRRPTSRPRWRPMTPNSSSTGT